jgi:spore germination protein GerM
MPWQFSHFFPAGRTPDDFFRRLFYRKFCKSKIVARMRPNLDPRFFSPYHNNVAIRKGTKTKVPAKKKHTASKKKPWGVIFWMGFFVLVFGLFLINRETIHNSIENIRRQTDSRSGGQDLADKEEGEAEDEPPEPAASGAVAPEPVVRDEAPQAVRPVSPQSQPVAAASPPNQSAVREPPPPASRPQAVAPVTPAHETRERTLYFTQVDREGTLLRVKVPRNLSVSDSPMVDSLTALIGGPGADEQRRGLISLIPKETKVLNATVRGSTAYISLNEDFQLNTHGVEGYAASLRQIVWTVTEFSNVKDVQILIEGRRIDYLGEGIWIGSPLDRETAP